MVNLLSRLFGRRDETRSIHNPEIPISSDAILQYLGGSERTSSGENVSTRRALMCSPVWQGVDLIAGEISRAPFLTYRRVNTEWGVGKERATEHPTYRVLRKHTGEMTANLFLSRIVGQALLYGNGFARIHRVRETGSYWLEWLHRDRVEVVRENGRLRYVVHYRSTLDAAQERMDDVSEDRIFHLVGLTLDELGGLSLIDYARDTIGRHLAAEHYADDFYANLAAPVGWFEHPAEMSAEAQKRFLAAVERRHGGQGKRHKIGILEEGMKWSSSGVTPHDALLIDAMGWGVKDVARFFNIPSYRLGDDSRTSYNSIEQENLAFFNSTLGKWVSRLEYEASWKLFTELERDADSHFSEFKTDAFFRADTPARYTAHSVAIQWGIKSRNEVRAEENLNPYEGGDEYLTPLNMSAGEEDDAVPPGEVAPLPASTDDERSERVRAAQRDILIDLFGRVARRVIESGRRAAKDPSKFLAWVNEIPTEHGDAVLRILTPAITAIATARDDDVAGLLGSIHDRTLGVITETVLDASECPADELRDRVVGSADRLTARLREVATDVVYQRG